MPMLLDDDGRPVHTVAETPDRRTGPRPQNLEGGVIRRGGGRVSEVPARADYLQKMEAMPGRAEMQGASHGIAYGYPFTAPKKPSEPSPLSMNALLHLLGRKQ
jgi:hypothetical protein